MAGVTDDPVSGTPAVAVVVAGAARKMGHLRRSGRATVAFTEGYQWVAVEGPVRIIGPDDPVEGFPPERLRVLLREVFTAAGGTHEDWEEYDRVMAAERRAAVFVAAARFSSND
jgi:hypothetical protein